MSGSWCQRAGAPSVRQQHTVAGIVRLRTGSGTSRYARALLPLLLLPPPLLQRPMWPQHLLSGCASQYGVVERVGSAGRTYGWAETRAAYKIASCIA